MSGQADKTSTPTPWITNYTGNVWGDANNQEHDGDFPLLGNFYNAEDAKKCCEAVNSIRSHTPSSDLVGVVQDTIAWLEEISTVPHNSDCDSLNVANYADEDNECDCFHRGRRLILQLLRRAALSGVANGETEARHGK